MKIFINFLCLFFAISIINQNIFAQVNVSPNPASYTTLKEAFDSINVGHHTGAVTVTIVGNTTESATASLNASGAGLASYSSVSISPSGGSWTITAPFSGALIKLNGADNVTIDGRIGGTGRNLTLQSNSVTAGSTAVWVASTGVVDGGATKNTIRNCEIVLGIAQNASTSATYGIIQTGTTISLTSTDAIDNDSNQYLENRIIKSRYGIVLRGPALTNLNEKNLVSGNIIGPESFGADQIGKVGIYAQFQNNLQVTLNKVQYVGGTFAQTTGGSDRIGIAIGGESWSAAPTNSTSTNNIISQNIIHDVIEERTFSAVGIGISTTNSTNPTGNKIFNNVIYNVRANGTAGDVGLGIGHSGGKGDSIVYNSISMTGDIDPAGTTTSTTSSSGMRISTTSDSSVTMRDNSIYVDLTSNTATLKHYDIIMPATSYTWVTGSMNYNDYYFNSANTQMRLGGIGTVTPYTDVNDLTAWKVTFTPNQDANSISADPLYNAPNLNLRPKPGSPLYLAGSPVGGITTDILGVTRNATTPTIGAYEDTVTVNIPVDVAVTANVAPTGTIYTNNPTIAPKATFAHLTGPAPGSFNVTYNISPDGYSSTKSISLAISETKTITFDSTYVPNTPGVKNVTIFITLASDPSKTNDTLKTTFTVLPANNIQAVANIEPVGTLNNSSPTIAPKASFKNVGASVAYNVDVSYQISGPVNYSSTKIVDSITVNQTRTITFDSTFVPNTIGSYNVTIISNYVSDGDRSNDTIKTTFNITNPNFGSGATYFFANSTTGASGQPSQPQFCWKDTTGSTSLCVNTVNSQSGIYTGTSLDDGYWKVLLPGGKKVRFFGADYDTVRIGTNGIVAFQTYDPSFSAGNHQPPATGIPGGTVLNAFYPLWWDANFGTSTPTPTSRLSYKIAGSQLIITFDRAPRFSGAAGDYVSYQVCMDISNSPSSNSRMLVQYADTTGGRTGAAFVSKYNLNTMAQHLTGLQNAAGTSALTYRFRNASTVLTAGPYFNSPLGNLAVQFGPSNTNLDNACKTLNLTFRLEAIQLSRKDTVTVGLLESSGSFALIESYKRVYDSTNGTVSIPYTLVENNPEQYYIQVSHRNSIKTYSNLVSFTANTLNYDFTSNICQALGCNQALVTVTGAVQVASFFSGDVNQDNCIEIADVSDIDNDGYNFICGNYVITDLNFDGCTDVADAAIADNNLYNFVCIIPPPAPPPPAENKVELNYQPDPTPRETVNKEEAIRLNSNDEAK